MTRPSVRRGTGRALLGAVLAVLAWAGVGCATAVTEVPSRSVATVTSEAFLGDGGFAALPRAQVLLGGTDDADAALRITAAVAATPDARARGLMGVSAVPDGVGMLFVFPDAAGPGRPGFWMLDTLVPLDIAFAADGVVVGVATMWPCTVAPCPVTHPGVDYDVALEVASGVLEGAGIGVGDRFVWWVEERRPVEGSGRDAG